MVSTGDCPPTVEDRRSRSPRRSAPPAASSLSMVHTRIVTELQSSSLSTCSFWFAGLFVTHDRTSCGHLLVPCCVFSS